jgi:hypothetical protein
MQQQPQQQQRRCSAERHLHSGLQKCKGRKSHNLRIVTVIPLLLRLQLLESRRLRSLLLALLPPVSYGQRRPSCLFEAAWPSGSAWRGRRALPRGLWGRPHRRLAGAAHPTRPQRVPRRFRLACSLPLARGGPGFRRRGPGARRRRRLRAARGRGDLVRCPLLAAVPRLPPLLLRPCAPPSRGRVRVSEALPFRACLSPPAADPLPLSLPLSASLSPPAADPLVPLSLPLSASLSPPAADPLPLRAAAQRFPLSSCGRSASLPRPCPRL